LKDNEVVYNPCVFLRLTILLSFFTNARAMKFYAWIIILIFMTTSGVTAMLIVLNRKREQAEERAKHEKELEMMHSEKLASLERLTSGIASVVITTD
jgi:hypothetical protein